jgi:hypothetical protein
MTFSWPSSFPRLRAYGSTLGLLLIATTASAQENRTSFQKPTQPSLNFYGLPGAIDTPSATPMPDGQVAIAVSNFAGTTRTTFSFQATPRLSASFRYIGIQNFNSARFSTYRDRSFDIKYLALREGKYRPAVSIGLQDFAGTGIYAGEYVVATKSFETAKLGNLTVSGGLGWGRLGSSGSIGSPFGGNRPAFDPLSTGGSPSYDQWFRGPAAPFASVEWQVSEKVGLKAEYSSDDYAFETGRGIFTRKSRLNFGAEYQVNERFRVGGYFLHGSEIGLSAQLQFNPKRAIVPLQVAAPASVLVRPTRQANPSAWTTAWAQSETAPIALRDIIAPKLSAAGLRLEHMKVSATSVELRVSNHKFHSYAPAIGRSARILAEILPPSVETFTIVPVNEGLALTAVTIRRSDLEALEFHPNANNALLAVTGITDATPNLEGAVGPIETYPKFDFAVGPYVAPSYFDPDEPVRADAGISAKFKFRPAEGWVIAGELRHRLAGNVTSSNRLSDSPVQRVRTEALLYAQAADTTLNNLYVSKQWKPRSNLYARVSAGYFESMFGGVSAELLWKPTSSRLAVGLEANYAQQRDFNQRLGFRDYGVATGHVSAYYEFNKGYQGQLDVGKYLAGDVGATLTLSRKFQNGFEVGGFVTLTDMASTDFGEGSFDKGVMFTIPISWMVGRPSQNSISTVIRPIQRDGGARLNVPGRLYNNVRAAHKTNLSNDWSRVWE